MNDMKKVLCLVIAVLITVTMACSVFATGSKTDGDFIPSISYTDHPTNVPYEGVEGDEKGREVWGEIRNIDEFVSYFGRDCLLVTSVYEALNDPDVPADVREELLEVYYALLADEMQIPYEMINKKFRDDFMSLRDLFDVRWLCEEHRKLDELEGHHITARFYLGVPEDVTVYAMVYDYDEEEWTPAVSVINNGDGTVTCTIEDAGIVAFSVLDETDLPLWMTKMWNYIRKVVAYLI